MSEDLSWFSGRLHAMLDAYVSLNEAQIDLLYKHFTSLLRWNSKMNLTSVRAPDQIVARHYCESLFFAANMPVKEPEITVADVGSGAGFPGVPLAVLRPDWQIALIESGVRKAVFLRESARAVRNIRVIAERAEAVSDRFDWIVSRAVRPLDVIALTPKLSSRLGLLVSEKDWATLCGISQFRCCPPVSLPWSPQRLCAYCFTWNTVC